MIAESPKHDPPSSESPLSRFPSRSLAFGLFIPLIVYTAVTRLMALGLKPVQHDESMFAYYSHLITLPPHQYKFLPILHGPLLEWATAGVFTLFGDSDATMRLFPALCGIGIAAAVWGMRKVVGDRAALLSVGLIALSPTLLFFSRFCRNDLPFLFTATVMLGGFVLHGRSGKAVPLFIALLAAAVAVTIKETWVIFFFIQLAFLAACTIYALIKRIPLNEAPVVGVFIRSVRTRFLTIGFAVSTGLFLIVAFYSSFFEYREHADGVIESFQYWMEEHKRHRIEGPYHFYLIHLAIYEFPFLAFWLGALVHGFWVGGTREAGWPRRMDRREMARWCWLVISVLSLIGFWNAELPEVFDRVAHMTLGLHVWMAAQLILLVCVAGWRHLDAGRPFHAFADCWAGASFVIYSYAGEKVPWVTAHIALPLILSCALYADRAIPAWNRDVTERIAEGRRNFLLSWGAAGLATVSLGWMLWLSLFLSFINSGNPIERHTYASSHPEFHLAVQQVVREAEESFEGYDSRIAFEGELAWPLWWSLRKFELKTPKVYPEIEAPWVILDEYAYNAAPEYLEAYTWQRVRFRHYWQPEPLDWRAMRRIDLILRNPDALSETDQAVRDRGRTAWLKLAKAMLLRDENIQGPTRWDELGGLDAYIGRRKPETAGLFEE